VPGHKEHGEHVVRDYPQSLGLGCGAGRGGRIHAPPLLVVAGQACEVGVDFWRALQDEVWCLVEIVLSDAAARQR
jgi:hypothetical protein